MKGTLWTFMMHWFEPPVFGQGSTYRHQTTFNFFQLKIPPLSSGWLNKAGKPLRAILAKHSEKLSQEDRETFEVGIWRKIQTSEPDRKRTLGWRFPPKWLDQIHMVHKWLEKFDIIFHLCCVPICSCFKAFLQRGDGVDGVMGVLTGLKAGGFKIGCLLYHPYCCWWFRNPAPHEVGSLSHYL